MSVPDTPPKVRNPDHIVIHGGTHCTPANHTPITNPDPESIHHLTRNSKEGEWA